jgi:hypothetical protein
MPKSRGRAGARRPATRPSPSSWLADVVTEAKVLLDPETTRTYAELFASDVLGRVAAARRSITEDELVAVAVHELTAFASRRRTPQAAALVTALAAVTADDSAQAASDEWAAPLLAHLPWASAPAPLPVAASVAHDPYDDERDVFLAYDDCVVVAQTSRGMGGAVLTLRVTAPDVLARWDEDAEAWPREPVPVERAVGDLGAALEVTESWWPPHDDEEYLANAAFVAGRLRATGVAPTVAEWEELSDDDREQLLDRFFAEADVADDDPHRALADLCVDFADGYVGDPLLWSPAVVERFLLEWVPSKADLGPEEQRRLPELTRAFVRWALTARGVPADAVDGAVAAVQPG